MMKNSQDLRRLFQQSLFVRDYLVGAQSQRHLLQGFQSKPIADSFLQQH